MIQYNTNTFSGKIIKTFNVGQSIDRLRSHEIQFNISRSANINNFVTNS